MGEATPVLLARARALLDDDERARTARLLQDADRAQLAVSHALLRAALSAASGLPLAAWRFRTRSAGRPELDPALGVGLDFNLAHSREVAVVAVGPAGLAIGADVEWAGRAIEELEIAGRFFAPEEARALGALDAGPRRRHFYTLWTLKEAWVKALGIGVSGPLEQALFTVDASEKVQARLPPGIEPPSWTFRLWQLFGEYLAALAVGCAAGVDVEVVLTDVSERLSELW
jgi:4'-phosphopantetheinyl transferase